MRTSLGERQDGGMHPIFQTGKRRLRGKHMVALAFRPLTHTLTRSAKAFELLLTQETQTCHTTYCSFEERETRMWRKGSMRRGLSGTGRGCWVFLMESGSTLSTFTLTASIQCKRKLPFSITKVTSYHWKM